MAKARFGTDGVRGVANDELTAELALAIGRATARILPAPGFVIGRDTRRSGPMLSAALAAGLATEGADVFDLGVLPTPGVATVAARRRLPGAVVSASHNPFGDNGIKLFSSLGTKLPLALEADVEREISSIVGDSERPPRRPTGHGVGRIIVDPGAADLYRDELVAATDGRTLEGLHIVVDCANGAASAIAPGVLTALGATVTVAARHARRGQHQREVRLDRTPTSWPGRSPPAKPTSVWPSTATPIVSSPSTTPGWWWTATSSWPCSPSIWPAVATWPATRWW